MFFSNLALFSSELQNSFSSFKTSKKQKKRQLVFQCDVTSALRILLSILWQTFISLSRYNCKCCLPIKAYPNSSGWRFLLLCSPQYLVYSFIISLGRYLNYHSMYVSSLCLVSFWSRGYFYILNI